MTSSEKRSRKAGQLFISIGVVVLGVLIALGTLKLPAATGYSKVGPRLVPVIVSGGLILLGLVLLKEACAEGFRNVNEDEGASVPTHWFAFIWISAAMLLNGILMTRAGFVIAGVVMFVMTARGFGSVRWLPNTLIGIVIASVTYAFFNYGLGLTLPSGLLPF